MCCKHAAFATTLATKPATPFATKTAKIFATLIFAALMCPFAPASTPNSTVGQCAGPGTHYTTIQAAVNATAAGAIIEICPANYPEQVTITKNLTLLGIRNGTLFAPTVVTPQGGLVSNTTDISGNQVAPQIFVQNADVTISHLTVDGSNNGLSGCSISPIGIYYKNSSGEIEEDAVRNVLMDPADQGCQIGLAINVESNTGTPAVSILDNSVRNYDKGGITASGPGTGGGPAVTVSGNTVIGIGATTALAQNGIQVSFGATGSVTNNDVADDIYTNSPNCGANGQPQCYAASGILIYASSGITVTGNTVESTQLGIALATDPSYGNADNTVVKSNHVGGTQTYDAIDLCSDSDTAESNLIYGATQSGIHVDDSCSPSTGSNTTVTGNTINEACAGILLGTGSSNTTAPDNFFNVIYTTLSGDTCPPPTVVSSAQNAAPNWSARHLSFRPSPFIRK